MLDIPIDHKTVIYSFLDIKSLIRLGSTCKTFHNDKGLILRLVQKVVDSYFFCSSSRLGIIHNWLKFPYEKLFYQIYIEKLKKISFDHLELVKNSKTNRIQSIIIHQQLRHIEIKDPHSSDYHIQIFIDPILCCPRSEKKQIYTSLFQFIGKNFSFARSDTVGLNLYLNYLGIKIFGSLRQLFKHEKDRSMRKLMIMEMDKFSESLSKSAGGTGGTGGTGTGGTGPGGPYFTLDNFISVNHDEYIRDVIDIGDILLSLNKKKEFKSLYDEFVADFTSDVSSDPIGKWIENSKEIKDTFYQLNMKYQGGLTYEKKLCEMLKQIDIDLLEEDWLTLLEDIVKTHS
jgi:hypothetical protein